MPPRHFLDLDKFDRATLRSILDHARAMKNSDEKFIDICRNKILLMIFDKPSTRTRISFDVAMRQLGGETITLNATDMQLGRGETIADTARVLSRYADGVVLRTNNHAKLVELADNASIPVINGLTDLSHPCQILADFLTFEEKRGPIEGKTIAWIGDGNNVAVSWIHGAARLGFKLRLACPDELRPPEKIVAWAKEVGGDVIVVSDPEEAAAGADALVTDVWVSMGDTDIERRHEILKPYQVNEALMKKASPDAIFLHCLPAHRGDEVTSGVIDGPQSVIFDEAENRLHIQKAILAYALKANPAG